MFDSQVGNRELCMKFKLLTILIVLNIACITVAQTDTTGHKIVAEILSMEDLMKMGIDIASFKEKNIFNTPSTVSIIDKETIKKYNIMSIGEAISTISGISVMRSYLKRDIPTSRGILQDNYANKILIMINGIPLWNAVTGETCLDRFSINDVEKIEVLKGPGSVLYGTNAYSGAINVVLKSTYYAKASVNIKYGENNLFSAGGNFMKGEDEYSLFVSSNTTQEIGSDYLFVDQVGQSANVKQYMRPSNFTLNAKYGGHGLLFNAYNVDESYLGVSPKVASGAGKNHNNNGYMFSYNFDQRISGGIKLAANVTYDWEERILSRTFDDDTRADVVGQRVSGVISAVYSPMDELALQLGAEYASKKSIKYDNISVQKGIVLEDNYMKGKSVYDYSFYGQLDVDLDPFTILTGVRYNQNELFGGNVSSRATVVYSLNKKNSLKLVYGTSYRSPSLFELYFRTSTNTVFGNTLLKPEECGSLELSYLTSFGNLFIQALGYYSSYTNKIFRNTGSVVLENGTTKTNVSVYQNGEKFSSKGIEIETKYRVANNIDAFVNYTFTSGDNGDEVPGSSHYNFKYIPKHTLFTGISKQFGFFSFAAMANYVSERGSVFNTIGSSVTLDLNGSFTQDFGELTVRHNLTVKNIFNKTILFPEYVSRALNDVPSGYAQQIFYSLTLEF